MASRTSRDSSSINGEASLSHFFRSNPSLTPLRFVSHITHGLGEGYPRYPWYSERDIETIGRLLAEVNPSWGRNPRTYIVLRLVNKPSLMDTLLTHDFHDYKFPLTHIDQVPEAVHMNIRKQMMQAQHAILPKTFALEKGRSGRHVSFQKGEPGAPYKIKGSLGKGRFGSVDKVESLLSHRVFARKTISRGIIDIAMQKKKEGELPEEIGILKKLNHHHMIEFVGSYSEGNKIAILMSPVADCHLESFLNTVTTSTSHTKENYYQTLRSFFGCLITGLSYLHDHLDHKIRHKDISPRNILVKDKTVLFTDFGLSRAIENGVESKSYAPIIRGTEQYAAPEVWDRLPRGRSADIWSLGCIYLEMVGALVDKTIEDREEYFSKHGTTGDCVRTNTTGYHEWTTFIESSISKFDRTSLSWVKSMLERVPGDRPSANTLVQRIAATVEQDFESSKFLGRCCRLGETSLENNNFASTSTSAPRRKRAIDGTPASVTPASVTPATTNSKRKRADDVTARQTRNKRERAREAKLWAAVKNGDNRTVVELLYQGADPEDWQNGMKPLHLAAEKGSVDIVRSLLDAGSNAADKASDGTTPLICATEAGKADMIDLLMNHGAEVDASNENGYTPISFAAKKGDELVARRLVQQYNADVNLTDKEGGTPLGWAAWNGHLGIVMFLAHEGAATDDADIRWGRTPCSWAAENGHWDVVDYLINTCGAEADSVSADQFRTPLSYAAGNCHLQVVLGLLASGKVEAHRSHMEGKSALYHAKAYKRMRRVAEKALVIKALEDHVDSSEPSRHFSDSATEGEPISMPSPAQ